jgi:hypothetical protein
VLADVIQRKNVWMIQRRGGFCFLLKTVEALSVRRIRLWQKLDCHFSLQHQISGPINFAHAASTQKSDDFIRPEFCARGQDH